MRRKKSVLSFLCMVLFSICLLVPIAVVVSKSSMKAFEIIFTKTEWFYPKLWKSLLYALVIGVGGTFIAFLTAFGLINGHFKCRGLLLSLILLLMLMPLQATLLPNYIGLRDLNLLDTPWALILPMVCSPFAIFLMYQYMKDIPEACIEAARLETGSVAVILFRIVLPQIKGYVAAVYLFLFAEGFNMVEQPLYYVKKESLQPLSVVTTALVGGDVGIICAIGIVCLIPITILYICYDRAVSE